MKKVVLILVVLVLLAAAAVGIFLSTFNADRYRPVITQKISQALGNPVDLGRISLVWNNGVAVRFEKLIVYSSSEKREEALRVGSASGSLRFGPLLQKKIEVSSILIKDAAAYVVKTPDGQVQLKGVKFPQGQAKPQGESGASSPQMPMTFSIDVFRVENAEVHFADLAANPPMDLTVRDADVTVRHFSLTEPFDLEAHASLLSSKQNLHVDGKVLLPQSSDPGFISDLVVKTDLEDLDLKQLAQAVPSLQAAGITQAGGGLEVSVGRLSLDPKGLGQAKAEAHLAHGSLKTNSVRGAFSNVDVSVTVQNGDLNIKNISADFAKGTLKLSGLVRDFQGQALSGFHWVSKDLAIEELAPEAAGNAPKLSGRLSADFEGQAAGLQGPQLTQSLSGRGMISLRDGVLLDYNLLREVIQKISIIPGADEAIRTRLPGLYRAKLDEPSTLLKPVEMPIIIQNGQIIFERMDIATDVLSIRGSGQAGFDKTIMAKASLQLDRDLTAAVAASVPQTQLLVNPEGRLEVPVQVMGQLPRVAILPDTDYIGQKLLASKAQEIVTGLIQDPSQGADKLKNIFKSTTDAGAKGAEGSAGTLKNIFGQLTEDPEKAVS